MASNAWKAAWLGVLVCALLLSSFYGPGRAVAVELLQNGGFEDGTARWTPRLGFSTSGCAPRTGNAAGVLTTTNQESAFVNQNVAGPVSPGLYVFSGYARAESGSAGLSVALLWFDATGNRAGREFLDLMPTGEWATFSIQKNVPSDMSRVTVEARTTSANPGVICLDDFSLDGPALPTPTPTATATHTPAATPTATATTEAAPAPATTVTSTSPVLGTAVVGVTTVAPTIAPSATPTLPATTATTSLPTATATAGTSNAPTFVFTNGGFEDGTKGWQKFGGELSAVSSPRGGGSSAGAFESNTTSTKWVFQLVRIDPAQVYEFKGYVRPEAGVAQAYLRISWYASSDAGGQAIATDDSTVKLSGSAGAFTYLTTGPKTPPGNARSARLRVVLTPAGASSATLYLDDFAFGLAPPMAGLPPPASTVAAPDEPFEAPIAAAPLATVSATSGSRAEATASRTRSPTPERTATRPRSPTPERTATRTNETSNLAERRPALVTTPGVTSKLVDAKEAEGRGSELFPEVAGVAVALFVAALGGAYFIAKRPREG